MPSRYALLNLHLFQRKVTQSPVRRHEDLHCGRVQGGHILSHFASVCLIFRPLDLFVFEKKQACGVKTFLLVWLQLISGAP